MLADLGQVVMSSWGAGQAVGDDFLGGLGLGDLLVEVGELAVGEAAPALAGWCSCPKQRLGLAQREPHVSKQQDHPDEPDR